MSEESKIKDLDTGIQVTEYPDQTRQRLIQEELSKLTQTVSNDISNILEFTRITAREIVNEEKKQIPQTEVLNQILAKLSILEKGQQKTNEEQQKTNEKIDQALSKLSVVETQVVSLTSNQDKIESAHLKNMKDLWDSNKAFIESNRESFRKLEKSLKGRLNECESSLSEQGEQVKNIKDILDRNGIN